MSAEVLIGGICEQDLDLFLLEECVSNRDFLTWLLAQVPGWPADCRELVAAERSVSQGNGESDLELTLRDRNDRKGMLLIENKLAAGFQPQQLARYRERAAIYVQQAKCAHARVILFAPSTYAHRSAGEVDAVVSYEAVESWLADSEPDERIGYKLQLMDAALTKHRLGYNPETDQAVTTFWELYWRAASVLAPELQLKEPGPKPARAGFVWFWQATVPEDLNICHKLPKGSVDLQVPGWGHRVPALRESLGSLLEPDMEVVRANKSAAIRIVVPVLHTGRPFEEQVESVQVGVGATKRLFDWANRNRGRICDVITGGSGDAA